MLRPQGVPNRRSRPGLRVGRFLAVPDRGRQEMNDDACACMAAYYHEYWFAGVAPWGAGRAAIVRSESVGKRGIW